jgi:hypothetical protein
MSWIFSKSLFIMRSGKFLRKRSIAAVDRKQNYTFRFSQDMIGGSVLPPERRVNAPEN